MNGAEKSGAGARFYGPLRATFPPEIGAMAKGIRKNISVPGLLAPALRFRTLEFGHRTVSPLAVELGTNP